MIWIKELRLKKAGIYDDEPIAIPKTGIVIHGFSHSGKTTVEKALDCMLSGGNEPSLIQQGADEAEIVLTFGHDNPKYDNCYMVKRLRRDGFDCNLYYANDTEMEQSPATFLNSIRKKDTTNAGRLLAAERPDDRIKIVMQVCDINPDENLLSELAGDVTFKKASNPFDTIENLLKALMNRRETIGSDARACQSAADKLEATLPPVSDFDPADEVLRLKNEKASLESNRDSLRENARQARDSAVSEVGIRKRAAEDAKRAEQRAESDKLNGGYQAEYNTISEEIADLEGKLKAAISRRDTLKANHDQLLDELPKKHLTEITLIGKPFDDEIKGFEDACNHTLHAISEDFEREIGPLNTKLAAAEQRVIDRAAIEAQRAIINGHQADADAKRAEYNGFTNRIERVRELRRTLVSHLPAKDVDIIDGDIHFEKRKWDILSTSEQLTVAIKLLEGSNTQLQTIIADRLESCDDIEMRKIRDELLANNKQAILTRVETMELTFTPLQDYQKN
ncbi:MAG: hypothetical protein JSS75_07370 [Bacteroidetes bacterium]|nr:hypothetical protein [Bacteroidota bacterium]